MIGFRIQDRNYPSLDKDLLARFATVGTAQISDCMGRLYGVVGLRAFHNQRKEKPLVGQALTVKTRPGDNLMIHKAISLAMPGEVLVIDGGGAQENALVGELMAMDARNKQIAGFVIDGSIRDHDYFLTNDFPCFARAVSHRGPYKDGPGEIGVPVSIGGQVVMPGDVLIGDTDGLVAVPSGIAQAVLHAALKKEQMEVGTKEKLASGTYEKPWVDTTIQARMGQS